MSMEQPTLSLRERDRRWSLARELMKKEGLDCLVVTAPNTYYSPNYFDAWLTDDNATGTVIFPLGSEPCYIVWSPMHGTLRMLENLKRGITPWLEDYRVYRWAKDGIVSILRERGLDSATIGVVGLKLQGPGAMGGIAYGDWLHVIEQLPKATIVDIADAFAQLTLVKSEEEIELARYAAYVGDLACEAMLKVVKPGVSESEIYATIMYTILKNAANALHVIMQTGVNNLSWGMPIWTYKAQVPPIVQKGDLVQAEIFPIYGGIESQQQMSIATKPVATLTQELANVARRSYDAAINTMHPGITFGEVCDAMEKPIKEAGCWYLTPLAHTMNPNWLTSGLIKGLDQLSEFKGYVGLQEAPMSPSARNLVLKPGMMFELEPNACRGTQKVNVGGTVIITDDGVEELNKIAAEMRIVD